MDFFTNLSIATKDSNTTIDLEKAKSILFRLQDESEMLHGYKFYLIGAFPLIVSQLKTKEVNAYNSFIELIDEHNKLSKQFNIRLDQVRSEAFFSDVMKRETERKLKKTYDPDFKEVATKQKTAVVGFIKPALAFATELNEVLTNHYQQDITVLKNIITELNKLSEASEGDGVVINNGHAFDNVSSVSTKENYFDMPMTNEQKAKSEPFPRLLLSQRGRLLEELKEQKGLYSYDWYSFDRVLEREAKEKGMTLDEYKDFYAYNKLDEQSVEYSERAYYNKMGQGELDNKLYDDYIAERVDSLLDKSKDLHYLLEF